MAMNKQGISIIIPAFNEESFLPSTLKSVRAACAYIKSKYGHPSEIIVVDNASTDKTSDVAKKLGAHVYSHEKRNISSVRNAGISKANFSIIVAIDADCLLPEDSLFKVWNFMSDESYIGASLGLKIISDKRLISIIAIIIQYIVSKVSRIQGAVFVFRKNAALAIGGFSEEHLVAEDSIFAISMSKYAKTKGKKFGMLFSVKVSTLDRKNITVSSLPSLSWQILNAFLGRKQKVEELNFWYNSKR